MNAECLLVASMLAGFTLLGWAGYQEAQRDRERFFDRCAHAKGTIVERPSGRVVCYAADGSMFEWERR